MGLAAFPRPKSGESGALACAIEVAGWRQERANRWLSSFQFLKYGRLPCDFFAVRPASCAGWMEFYEAKLAEFYQELFGHEVQVVPDGLDSTDEAGAR